MSRPHDPRPWRRPPRCPRCGRPVHRPTAGLLLTLRATVGGWTLEPHVCLDPAARYPPADVAERRWTALDVIELFAEMDRRRGDT